MLKPLQTFAISIVSYSKHLKVNETAGLSPQQRKALKNLQTVLQKNIEKRTAADDAILYNFIRISYQNTSVQLCRDLLKNSKIVKVPSGRVICQEGKKVTSIYLLLTGKLGKAIPNHQTNFTLKQEDRYQALMEKSSKRLRQYKLYIKQTHQQMDICKEYKQKVDIIQLPLSSTISANSIYGQQSFLDEEKYHETVVTVFSSSFLQINIIDFMQAYYHLRQKILETKIQNCIKACDAFKDLSEDRFKYLVSKLQIVELDKGQTIYSENQAADCLYIILKGQVGLSKKVHLFAENPNNLYANRSILLQEQPQNDSKAIQKKSKELKSKSLRYADFTSIYNYYPKEKYVQLTSLQPVSLFGEQQVFQNIPRQVNAYAITNDVQLFKIPLKLLQTVFTQKKNTNLFDNFKKKVYEVLTKQRILYRQEKLADILDFQNKHNMDYFYIESNDVPALSPNNSRLKISSQSRIKRRPQSSSPHRKTSKEKLYIKKLNMFIKPLQKIHKKQQQGPAHPAFYNSFNFTKMPTAKQMEKAQKQFQLNQQELKVINLTHTVKQLSMQKKRKVNLAKYKGDKKYNIDIKNPLFQLSFFRERQKQMLRIEKQKRNRNFMTSRPGTPVKTRPHSAKSTYARAS